MNLYTHVARAPDQPGLGDEPPRPHPDFIEIVEPDTCTEGALPPEGNVKLRNYRLVEDNLRAYTPTGDVHTSPAKGKLVSRYEVCSTISPPRERILELLRPEDPGREALEAIVKPAPRRGLVLPLDEDARKFLQRALLSPSPQGRSAAATPEPETIAAEEEEEAEAPATLAEELREADEDVRTGTRGRGRRNALQLYMSCGVDALERERLGRLALSVEEDEAVGAGAGAGAGAGGGGLTEAARRLDALLAESRQLHDELAEIHEDIQEGVARAGRCAAAARLLGEESRRMGFLDDVLALLRGDVAAARLSRHWPFAVTTRHPHRNYII